MVRIKKKLPPCRNPSLLISHQGCLFIISTYSSPMRSTHYTKLLEAGTHSILRALL